ncbi:hypothetical protein PoB_001264400 [Plakobranchus ocellatus]|uniref:Uncharacterized protein n=1 Tax=Plakobranchus ocellatus TaxID=259542 RepID=A0AAV3YWN9_9GAST|nr:hypothetical protein PoB_001264400 [Plakobranchus ocellatus]
MSVPDDDDDDDNDDDDDDDDERQQGKKLVYTQNLTHFVGLRHKKEIKLYRLAAYCIRPLYFALRSKSSTRFEELKPTTTLSNDVIVHLRGNKPISIA